MRRKGFTLVELLAVIVILVVIGIVTVPIVLNYIERSRINSYKISVNEAIEAAKEYVAKTEENYDFPEGGIEVSQVDLKLEKEKFISGVIKRNEEGVIVAEKIYNGEYCASGNKNYIIVEKVSSEEECKGIDTTAPEVKVKINNTTATSITVVAQAKDSISKIKSYEYCIGDECSGEIEKNNYTFKELKPGKEYKIKVIVKNENSGKEDYPKETTDRTVEITGKTGIVESATFEVSTSSYAGRKEVTIKYPEGNYEYRYEILDIEGKQKEAKEVEEKEVKLNIEENCIIKAYVKYENKEVENEIYIMGIDQKGPKVVVIMNDSWEKQKQIKVIAKDEVGIATKGYSYDGGKNWTSNNLRTYKNNQKVKLVVRDKLGNVTESYKICKDESEKECYEATEIVITKVDNVEPTCSLKVSSGTLGNNSWYTSNVTIDFELVNDTAKNEEGKIIEGSGIASQTIDKASLTKDGKYTITGTVIDGAGNKGTCKLEVKVDKTKPSVPTSEIRYETSSGTIRGSINDWTNRTLWWGNYKATDNLSGIDHYEYSTGCSGIKSGKLENNYTYSQTVDYTFCIRSVDKAGVASDWSSPYYIKVDKTKPSVPTSEIRYDSSSGTIRGNVNSFINRTLWWGNFQGTDQQSGIDHYEYSTGCSGSKSGNLNNIGYTYINDTNYAFCIRSVDKVGNVSNWSSPYYIKVDKTPPTIWLNPIGTRYGDGYQNGLTVSVMCSDNLSGISLNTGTATLYGPGWRSVNGTCRDGAGNTSTTSGSYLIYVYTADENACGTESYVCGQYQCGTENYNCSYCKYGSPSVCQGGYVTGTTYGQCSACGSDYSRCKEQSCTNYCVGNCNGRGYPTRSSGSGCQTIGGSTSGTNAYAIVKCCSCSRYYHAYCNSCPTQVWSDCATTINTCQYGCDTRPTYCDNYCQRAKSCWHL